MATNMPSTKSSSSMGRRNRASFATRHHKNTNHHFHHVKPSSRGHKLASVIHTGELSEIDPCKPTCVDSVVEACENIRSRWERFMDGLKAAGTFLIGWMNDKIPILRWDFSFRASGFLNRFALVFMFIVIIISLLLLSAYTFCHFVCASQKPLISVNQVTRPFSRMWSNINWKFWDR